jgi:hypothetical protein
MGPGFQRDSTARDLAEHRMDSFRCRWQAALENHVACLIQDAVMACSVSQIQTDGQLGFLKIPLPRFATVLLFFTAGLLSLVLRARRLMGSVSHPVETGLLIPSEKRPCSDPSITSAMPTSRYRSACPNLDYFRIADKPGVISPPPKYVFPTEKV